MSYSTNILGYSVKAFFSKTPSSTGSVALGSRLNKTGRVALPVSVYLPEGVFSTALWVDIVPGQIEDVVLGLDWYTKCVEWFHLKKLDMGGLPKPVERGVEDGVASSSQTALSPKHLPLPFIPLFNASVSSTSNSSGSQAASEGSGVSPDTSTPGDWKRGESSRVLSGHMSAVRSIVNALERGDQSIHDASKKGLRRTLLMHGMSYENLDKGTMQTAVIHHLINGMCACSDREECHRVSGGRSQKELALLVSLGVRDSNLGLGSVEVFESICLSVGIPVYSIGHYRKHAEKLLDDRIDEISVNEFSILDAVAEKFESMPLVKLLAFSAAHGLHNMGESVTETRDRLMKHFIEGSCGNRKYRGCVAGMGDESTNEGVEVSESDLQEQRLKARIAYLEKVLCFGTSLRMLLKVAKMFEISGVNESSSRSRVQRAIKGLIHALKKGKQVEGADVSSRGDVVRDWPQVVPSKLKRKLKELFRAETSSDRLKSVVCAGCGEEMFLADSNVLEVTHDTDLSCFKAPKTFSAGGAVYDWDEFGVVSPVLPLFSDPRLAGLLLDPKGVHIRRSKTWLDLCGPCKLGLRRRKLPSHALANDNYLGEVPPELTGLTMAEEMCISLCRPHVMVVKLKEEKTGARPLGSQRGFRGNIIVHPQRPEFVHKMLPPSLEEVASPICVLFVGSKKPSKDWLRKKAWPLCVRGNVIRKALTWLKEHNVLYKEIMLDEERLKELPEDGILPVHVEYVESNKVDDDLTSRYDENVSDMGIEGLREVIDDAPEDVLFQNVVIPDVDVDANEYELQSAAWRHMKKRGGQWVEIPIGRNPENEFNNPSLFPKMYPTLYPYGMGGFEDKSRRSSFYLKSHARHLFSLADRRFQEHYSMMFTVFNMLQRRAVLWQTGMKTKYGKYKRAIADYTLVSADAVHRVAERVAKGDIKTAYDAEEKRVLRLMREVNIINMKVPGSGSSRLAMRNEIRALMIEHGCPNFYLTINPADVYSPVLKFLAGHEIDIDALLPEEIPTYKEQSVLVAKNPVVAAKFFHIYMNAFLKCLLGYDKKGSVKEGGVLGKVKAHYGCVEAQGRGTLHCHMVIWVQGGLNPDRLKDKVMNDGEGAFRDRLMRYLEDVIGSGGVDVGQLEDDERVPSMTRRENGKRVNPSSVRAPRVQGMSDTVASELEMKDLALLVEHSQRHKHGPSCYKYGDNVCRYDLDECNRRLESSINLESGEVCVRCLDGMINSYNETILQALRCNMDIKFIGSGASAKAILYYITDYISKSQLKAHVAYAALDVAIQKISQVSLVETRTAAEMARTVLRKCANAMLARQELSAQQVGSYLTNIPDHYTSHKFKLFFWTQFESYIDAQHPSPECGVAEGDLPEEDCEKDDADEDVNADRGVGEGGLPNNSSVRDDNEEVMLHLVDGDKLELASTQLEDYIYRGDRLRDVCLWDFVSRYEKIVKQRRKSTGENSKKVPTVNIDGCEEEEYGGETLNYLMENIEDEESDDGQSEDEYESDGGFVVMDSSDESVSESDLMSVENEIVDDDMSVDGDNTDDAMDVQEEGNVSTVVTGGNIIGNDVVRGGETINGESGTDGSSHNRVYFGNPLAPQDGEDQSELNAEILSKATEKNPRSILDGEHPLHRKYFVRLRNMRKCHIVVPVGCAIPRRDQLRTFPRYCRAMLLFFKPWRTIRDLLDVRGEETWEMAYQNFINSPNRSSRIVELMENIQVLHECKDSRDDHLRNRRRIFKRLFVGKDRIIQRETHFLEEQDQVDILDHIETCKRIRSKRFDRVEDNKVKCMESVRNNNLFSEVPLGVVDGSSFGEVLDGSEDGFEDVVCIGNNDQEEKIWRAEFNQRRKQMKENAKRANAMQIDDDTDDDQEEDLLPSVGGGSGPTGVSNGRFLYNSVPRTNNIDPNENDIPMSVEEFIDKWTLNEEQALAFKIVAEHSMGLDSRPLRMHLAGAAGTGKSRVLDALKDFFRARREERRFRVAAFMGVAARNIGGMTLHGALNLQANAEEGSKGERELQGMWKGVDYLFVDEVSMVGSRFLATISERLIKAKERDQPFGNISVIFAGDFAQLGAVLDQKLYTDHRRTGIKARKGGGANEKAACGRLLWLLVDIVVQLKEVMRQSGDDEFVDLLDRLRRGVCTDADVSLLNSRVIGTNGLQVDLISGETVPIIVSENVTKDAINDYAAEQFARRTGQDLHWYYSEDLYGNAPLTDGRLVKRLHDMHSGQTGHRLGKIPLVIGMPVMIGQNFDVEGGVANGARGKVRKIRFREAEDGRRYLTSCIVELDGDPPLVDPMTGLMNSKFVPVLREGFDMLFENSHSGQSLRIRRLQVPIAPAFAITAYKSQGLTLSKVVLDFGGVQGCEEPYVMMSRAKRLNGVFLLRPIQREVVTKQPSEDRRLEAGRLRLLAIKTKERLGNDKEKRKAKRILRRVKEKGLSGMDFTREERMILEGKAFGLVSRENVKRKRVTEGEEEYMTDVGRGKQSKRRRRR